jgi:hypothetical protein
MRSCSQKIGPLLATKWRKLAVVMWRESGSRLESSGAGYFVLALAGRGAGKSEKRVWANKVNP